MESDWHPLMAKVIGQILKNIGLGTIVGSEEDPLIVNMRLKLLSEGVQEPGPLGISMGLYVVSEEMYKDGNHDPGILNTEVALVYATRTLGQYHPVTVEIVNILKKYYERDSRYREGKDLNLWGIFVESEWQMLGCAPYSLEATIELSNKLAIKSHSDRSSAKPIETIYEDKPPETDTTGTAGYVTKNAEEKLEEQPKQDFFITYTISQIQKRGIPDPGAEEISTLLNFNVSHFIKDGKYDLAAKTAEATLAYSMGMLDKDHHNTLESVTQLAMAYEKQGRYTEAEALFLRALEARERINGELDPFTLIGVQNLAALYDSQARYAEAETLYLRALKGSEQLPEKYRQDTSIIVNNLAVLYVNQGRYAEAQQLLLRFIETMEQGPGKDAPETLTSINNLATLYQRQGRFGEAEPLFLRVIEANRRTLDKNHPVTLTSTSNLASLYDQQGRSGEAEALLQRAVLDIGDWDKNPQTFAIGHNLATVYMSQGHYAKAEPLLRRGLKANEQIFGKEHPQTLSAADTLAVLYAEQHRYDEAEALERRTLEARERVLGNDHPDTLYSVVNLAELYHRQGRYGEAESLYLRAVKSTVRVLGKTHPETLHARQGLAGFYLLRERPDAALKQLRLIEAGLRHWVEGELANTLSEVVRRQLLQTQSFFQSMVFNLALQWPTPQHQDYAAGVLLRWKAVGLEQEAHAASLARIAPDSETLQRLRKLKSARAELSSVVNQKAPDPTAKQRKQARVADLSARIDALERRLRQAVETDNAVQAALSVNAEEIRAALPKGSALIELRLFKRLNFETLEGGKTHVLALLLPSTTSAIGADTAEPRLRDLGPWQALEPEWQTAKSGVTGRDRGVGLAFEPTTPGLYKALFGPWDQMLAAYPTLFIAPDGRLQLTAFSALKLADGRYWVERQSLHRVTTGRDLLLSPTAEGQGLWAIGGADYQSYPEVAVPTHPQIVEKTPVVAPSADLSITKTRLRVQRGGFQPLPGTTPEARSVARDYREARADQTHLLLGRKASEGAIKALHAPRVLHLATHGFYLDAQEGETPRPLTRAGLALAGANLAGNGPDGEDGILYALEVLGLDLQGTELVTLSACDTGQGELDSSEGVYGLARAFRIAGARYVLMTLWPLNDALAQAFMSDFYQDWLSHPGEHPAAALRRTQLAFINSPDAKRRQPRHWAPYVLVESGLDN